MLCCQAQLLITLSEPQARGALRVTLLESDQAGLLVQSPDSQARALPAPHIGQRM